MLNNFLNKKIVAIKGILLLILGSLLTICVDQISKYFVVSSLAETGTLKVTDFLNLSLTYNKGISFSFFSGESDFIRYILISFPIIISLFLLYLMIRDARVYKLISFSLIIGGGLSNGIDRINPNYLSVVDFLDFHYNYYHYATFNLADSLIFVGALILLYSSFFVVD